jgi:Tol biopolymer transport system component
VTPELFPPGLVSTGLAERDVAISPDGREIYFAVTFRTTTTIMTAQFKQGRWTPPAVASFAADLTYYNMEPCMSGDGRQVFFRSADGTWAPGVNLGPVVNDPANTVHSPYISPDGKYFFFASNASRDRSPTPPGPLTLQPHAATAWSCVD